MDVIVSHRAHDFSLPVMVEWHDNFSADTATCAAKTRERLLAEVKKCQEQGKGTEYRRWLR